MSCTKNKRNERYDVKHGDDGDHGGNHQSFTCCHSHTARRTVVATTLNIMSLCLAPRASETEDMMLHMATMEIVVATIGLRSHRRKNRRCGSNLEYSGMS
jgi:hypothetical protein